MTAAELAKLTDAVLDILTAEKVMGWTRTRDIWSEASGLTRSTTYGWRPSTSLDQAFICVDAVRAKRPELTFHLHDRGAEVDALFKEPIFDHCQAFGSDKSRCRSIVISCLLACGATAEPDDERFNPEGGPGDLHVNPR